MVAPDQVGPTPEAFEFVIVLVLVLVWVVALVPLALKKRSDWELSSSISQFRQRRRVLVRLTPPPPGAAPSSPGRPATPPAGGAAGPRRDAGRDAAARARRQALQARRRRALGTLAGTFAGSLVLGAVPALRPLWDLALVSGLCTVAYLGALVYVRRLQEVARAQERSVVEVAARTRQAPVVPLHPTVVPLRRPPPFVIVQAGS